MSLNQLRRMEGIESWKRRAFSISKNDRIGLLVLHTLDAIQTIVRDGLTAETLQEELATLKMEHSTTMTTDLDSEQDQRALLYGVSWSVGSLIEYIIEGQGDGDALLENVHNIEDGEDLEFISEGYAKDEISAESDEAQSSPLKAELTEIRTEIKEELLDDLAYPTDELSFKEERIEDEDYAAGGSGSGARPVLCLPTFPPILRSTSGTDDDELRDNRSSQSADDPDYTEDNEPAGSYKQFSLKRKRESRAKINVREEAKRNNSVGDLLRKEMRETARRFGQLFTCNMCGRDFDTERGMTSHSYVHANSTKCDFCGIRIKCQKRLVEHISEYHAKESLALKKKAKTEDSNGLKQWQSKYHCEYCDATFRYPSKLAIHTRTHTGEKPFACNQCPETFTRTDNLKEHLRFKHGEKHYACKQCGEMFALRNELTEHVNKHYQ